MAPHGTATTYRTGCRCQPCSEAARESAKRYRETHRDAAQESAKRYRETHRDATREYDRQYYEANREAKLEYLRQYRQANLDAIRERGRIRAREMSLATALYRELQAQGAI